MASAEVIRENSDQIDNENINQLTKIKKPKKKLDLYRWQVAGHLPTFYYDGFLYKPSNQVEIKFYQNIPQLCHAIIPFIPKFYGVEQISSMNVDFGNHFNFQDNTQTKV